MIKELIQQIFRNPETERRHREIDAHCEMVNIRASIQNEAEEKFNKVWNQLNEKEKKKVDKERPLIVFSSRGDYLDWKRHLCEEMLEKRTHKSNKTSEGAK